MKIPFDVKYRPQIESGEYKVETRDGRTVRVLCWDRAAKEDQPKDLKLCVLVPENGGEAVYYYYSDGTKWVKETCFDLFIITPEPELREFELKLLDWLSSDTCGEIPMEKMKECVKNRAAELLELARKEALKDLPRWGLSTGCFDEGWLNAGILYYKFHAIPLKSLEKLPGFKEDSHE